MRQDARRHRRCSHRHDGDVGGTRRQRLQPLPNFVRVSCRASAGAHEEPCVGGAPLLDGEIVLQRIFADDIACLHVLGDADDRPAGHRIATHLHALPERVLGWARAFPPCLGIPRCCRRSWLVRRVEAAAANDPGAHGTEVVDASHLRQELAEAGMRIDAAAPKSRTSASGGEARSAPPCSLDARHRPRLCHEPRLEREILRRIEVHASHVGLHVQQRLHVVAEANRRDVLEAAYEERRHRQGGTRRARPEQGAVRCACASVAACLRERPT